MARDKVIQIRVSQEELEALHRRAAEKGVPVSVLVRSSVLGYNPVRATVAPNEQVRRCPASGCDFTALSPAARCPTHGRTVR